MKIKLALTEENFLEILRPRLMLFLSADIQGSSRLKHSSASATGRAWLPEVVAFLSHFPEEVAVQNKGSLEPLEPWKILGDEIIFAVEINRLNDVCEYLLGFSAAIEARNNSPSNFLVKGSAWIAGFPVANSIIPLADGSYDYLGASMDTGFRLGSLATPRRMALSVDLVWLLLKGNCSTGLYYEGRHSLKGIADSAGYPLVVWPTGQTGLEAHENSLLRRAAADRAELIAFCETYIREHGHPNHLPFLPADPLVRERPSDYEERYEEAREFYRKDVFDLLDPMQNANESNLVTAVDELRKDIANLQTHSSGAEG